MGTGFYQDRMLGELHISGHHSPIVIATPLAKRSYCGRFCGCCAWIASSLSANFGFARRTRAAGLRELQALARPLSEDLGVRDHGDDIRDARTELPAQPVIARLGVFDRVVQERRGPCFYRLQ